MSLIPWMEMGWNVVNVEYRLARVRRPRRRSKTPSARCASWPPGQDLQHRPVNRLVVTGESAGGHLTLTSAMIPESSGLTRHCAGGDAGDKRVGGGASTGTASPTSAMSSRARMRPTSR